MKFLIIFVVCLAAASIQGSVIYRPGTISAVKEGTLIKGPSARTEYLHLDGSKILLDTEGGVILSDVMEPSLRKSDEELLSASEDMLIPFKHGVLLQGPQFRASVTGPDGGKIVANAPGGSIMKEHEEPTLRNSDEPIAPVEKGSLIQGPSFRASVTGPDGNRIISDEPGVMITNEHSELSLRSARAALPVDLLSEDVKEETLLPVPSARTIIRGPDGSSIISDTFGNSYVGKFPDATFRNSLNDMIFWGAYPYYQTARLVFPPGFVRYDDAPEEKGVEVARKENPVTEATSVGRSSRSYIIPATSYLTTGRLINGQYWNGFYPLW